MKIKVEIQDQTNSIHNRVIMERNDKVNKPKKAKKEGIDCQKCTMIFFNEELSLEHEEKSFTVDQPFNCDECTIFSSCTKIGKV